MQLPFNPDPINLPCRSNSVGASRVFEFQKELTSPLDFWGGASSLSVSVASTERCPGKDKAPAVNGNTTGRLKVVAPPPLRMVTMKVWMGV